MYINVNTFKRSVKKILSVVSYVVLGIGSMVIGILGITIYVIYYITDRIVALLQLKRRKRHMFKVDRIPDGSRLQ